MKQVVTATNGSEHLGVPCPNGCGTIVPGPYRVVRAAKEHVEQWPEYKKQIARRARFWFFVGWPIGTIILFALMLWLFYASTPPHVAELWLASGWRTMVLESLFPLVVSVAIGSLFASLMSASCEGAYAGVVLRDIGLPNNVSHMQLTTDVGELGKGEPYYNRKMILLLPKEEAPA